MNCTQRIRLLALSFTACLFVGNNSVKADGLPSLHVSDNRRFLVTSDGHPFFWLGDTAWELFHRLNREEADRYLKKRAEQHFTIIQAVVIAELNGLKDPNPYGDVPLEKNNPTKPNEAYFKHVDWIVARANSLGLYVGMLPTWGNNWHKTNAIFTPQNAEIYGKWLGNRYKKSGLVWILGGDRPIQNDRHKEIISAMARGLREGDEGAHLITFHPPGGHGSSEWFHNEDWLSFNMRQNGHEPEYNGRYDQTLADYNLPRPKPVIDGEPIYEDHPISFNAKEHGYSIAVDVRHVLYWDLFGGAFGHTYGHHSVWQMWTAERKPVNAPLMSWLDGINEPGAAQMQYARALLESRPFLTRIPDNDLLVDAAVTTAVPGAGRLRFVATRDATGSYAMVYVPAGRNFRVNMSKINGSTVRAWWFNPRNGEANLIGTFKNNGEKEFKPPASGEMMDWVLVLDDASKRFPVPGHQNYDGTN